MLQVYVQAFKETYKAVMMKRFELGVSKIRKMPNSVLLECHSLPRTKEKQFSIPPSMPAKRVALDNSPEARHEVEAWALTSAC